MKTIMQKTIDCIFRTILLTAFFSGMVSFQQVSAQTKNPGVRIGTYDSRAVVFAYTRSAFFAKHQELFAKQSDSAAKAKDTARIRELSIRAMSYQHLLHQMVFGTGTTSAIMDLVKDQLPDLAKKEGVSMILSKFEVPFQDPSVETVDLTRAVMKLFKAGEQIDAMAGEIIKSDPVPLEDLTMEEELLDLYCKRFGNK